jgi:hypothetical protein
MRLVPAGPFKRLMPIHEGKTDCPFRHPPAKNIVVRPSRQPLAAISGKPPSVETFTTAKRTPRVVGKQAGKAAGVAAVKAPTPAATKVVLSRWSSKHGNKLTKAEMEEMAKMIAGMVKPAPALPAPAKKKKPAKQRKVGKFLISADGKVATCTKCTRKLKKGIAGKKGQALKKVLSKHKCKPAKKASKPAKKGKTSSARHKGRVGKK